MTWLFSHFWDQFVSDSSSIYFIKNTRTHSRENISLAIQFITGFNRLNKHQNTCNPTEVTDPECRYCMEDDESAWHVLAECPALWQNRIDVFDVPFLQQVPSWTTTQLVQFITMLRESLGSD